MSNYLTAPKNPKESLGVKAPYLIMFVKNVTVVSIWKVEEIFYIWSISLRR